MNNTAQVFADYLGLTEESAPWAYGPRHAHYRDRTLVLTATSPLAPSPTPGWLETLVRHQSFDQLVKDTTHNEFMGYAFDRNGYCQDPHILPHPTHAVALALIAADPALRAACEACEDWHNYKETHHD